MRPLEDTRENDEKPDTSPPPSQVTVVLVVLATIVAIGLLAFLGVPGPGDGQSVDQEEADDRRSREPTPDTRDDDEGDRPAPVPESPHGVDVSAATTGPTAYHASDLGRVLGYRDLEPSGSITTDRDGQVIERLDIEGAIRIAHDDVTIRAVRIRGGGRYAISAVDGSDASGTVIEYVEIDGENDPEQIGIYLRDFTLRNSHIYGQSTGVRFGSDSLIEGNYVHSQATVSGSHNTAMSVHGGEDIVMRGNNLEGSTSAALSLYPRLGPLRNILVEGNLFNGGSYCTYAGNTSNHVYRDDNASIRYVRNRFGRAIHDRCGEYGAVTGFDPSQPGNAWIDNTWATDGGAVVP